MDLKDTGNGMEMEGHGNSGSMCIYINMYQKPAERVMCSTLIVIFLRYVLESTISKRGVYFEFQHIKFFAGNSFSIWIRKF